MSVIRLRGMAVIAAVVCTAGGLTLAMTRTGSVRADPGEPLLSPVTVPSRATATQPPSADGTVASGPGAIGVPTGLGPGSEGSGGPAVRAAGAQAATGTASTPVGAAAAGAASSSAVGPLWYAIGDSPTSAEIDRLAPSFGVIVLNAWEIDALQHIKRVSPSTVVLAYKDLSSTRSYVNVVPPYNRGRASTIDPGGVTYDQALQHPDWFATDEAGSRIEWAPYPEHWQMAVWDPSYQATWAEQVATETAREPWDGVFADNDFASLAFYSGAVVAGTGSRERTDQRIRDGLDEFVGVAGQRLAEEGLLFVPNVSEARLYPGRWASHTRFGGGMEENFVRFGGGGQFVSDWGATGWRDVVEQAASPDRLTLLVTDTAGDDRAARYGWGSAMVAAQGTVTWMPSDHGDYTRPPDMTLFDQPLGAPRGTCTEWAPGVWAREFDGGWVVVNATDTSATVPLPPGARPTASAGVTVAGTDAAVVRRA